MTMINHETRNQFIASTILEQLGGNKFCVMTGAKYFSAGDACLMFSLPGTPGFVKGGINKIKIKLDESDTYTVIGYRIRGTKVAVKATVSDVYNDNLQQVFK